MSLNSDNSNRPIEATFTYPGSGMVHRFKCGSCGNPSLPGGCGVRAVMGLRQKVCTKCRIEIDARKAKTA